LRIIIPKVTFRHKATIDKIRNWDPGFHFCWNMSYFGMAVVHNLQVSCAWANKDSAIYLSSPEIRRCLVIPCSGWLAHQWGNNKHRFIVMTPFGEYKGGHLVIGNLFRATGPLTINPAAISSFNAPVWNMPSCRSKETVAQLSCLQRTTYSSLSRQTTQPLIPIWKTPDLRRTRTRSKFVCHANCQNGEFVTAEVANGQ
jgi:hypothetical protein